MEFIWMLIIGGLIGWIGGLLIGRNVPGGVLGNIIAGFLGAYLGVFILGEWGPVVANFAIFPSIVGAIAVVLLLSAAARSGRR
jgi:uncharacterized membrane protein YeaQ/YmgE (transglycosylase-associated protein family)